MLTSENYRKGYLVDSEWLAGITPSEKAVGFDLFVIDYVSCQSILYKTFPDLRDALVAVNEIKRAWQFEALDSCGDGSCGKCDQCVGSSCQQYRH